MFRALQQISFLPFRVGCQLQKQPGTCQGPFRNLSSLQHHLSNHQSKLPTANGMPFCIARCYSFKSVANYIHWSVRQILHRAGLVIRVKLPVVDVHAEFHPGSMKQYKQILPQPPRHSVIERPLEMKKLNNAFLAMERQKLYFQPAVVYLKGEPGVGKTQLARMYAQEYYKKWKGTDVIIATIDMTDFSSNYCELATRLGIQQDLATGLPLRKVAEKLKVTLTKQKNWLFIIDNYNSFQQEGFGRGT